MALPKAAFSTGRASIICTVLEQPAVNGWLAAVTNKNLLCVLQHEPSSLQEADAVLMRLDTYVQFSH